MLAPLFAGAVNVTRNVPDETRTAFVFCGWPGVPIVIGAVFDDGPPVPSEFVANTWNWYVRPIGRPLTNCAVAVDLYVIFGSTFEPRKGWITYPVIDVPPLLAGTPQITRATPLCHGTAETGLGAPGFVLK